jgi:hypothetical protein
MINLVGLSHAVIFFNTIAGEQKTGISAMMKLCFGKDTDVIGQILYCNPPGSKTPIWTLPTRTFGNNVLPIFTGSVGEEILGAVGRAAATFKTHYKASDGPKVGRVWRITKNGIEEIKEQATNSKS